MGSETSLETAQRIWPGQWTGRGVLIRKLADGMDVRLCRLGGGNWVAVLAIYGGGPTLGSGSLATTLTTARDRVQALARAFATSAGLEVRDGRAE